jgi:hypothetical protein
LPRADAVSLAAPPLDIPPLAPPFSDSASDEGIDGPDEGLAIALGQAVNLVNAVAQAFVLERRRRRQGHNVDAEKLVGGNRQDLGETGQHGTMEAKIASLVLR